MFPSKGGGGDAMNLKKIRLACLVTAIAFGFSNSSVLAVDPNTANTMGKVTFSEDASPTAPLDPLDPNVDKPIKSTDPDIGSGTAGPLSIDYVSNFHFGNQLISAEDRTYNVKLDVIKTADGKNVERAPFVQVTDKRGSNNGWTLQVQQKTPFLTSGAKELKGAYLSLMNPVVKTTKDNQAAPPEAEAKKIILTPGKSGSAGGAQTVLTAKRNTGMATWIESFGNNQSGPSSVQLFVPGISEKIKDATYSAILTWILVDSPVN